MIRMEPDQRNGNSQNHLNIRETTPFLSSRLTESLITPAMIGQNTGPGTVQKIND